MFGLGEIPAVQIPDAGCLQRKLARSRIADEFERFAELEEGAADVLLTNRTAAFYDGFVCFISTPLLVDGKIHAQFKLTDQRRYFLRCEACGQEAYTTWSDPAQFRVVYRDQDPQTARLACPSCDVTVYNVKDDPQAAARAKAANVQRLPMVLVDGKPADCCQVGPVTEAGLRAAGIGTP